MVIFDCYISSHSKVLGRGVVLKNFEKLQESKLTASLLATLLQKNSAAGVFLEL